MSQYLSFRDFQLSLIKELKILEKDELNKVPSPEIFKTLSKEEQRAIMELDSIKEFKKGERLISEGEYFKESYFVVEGCVRKFRIVDGVDVTNEFYSDNETIFSAAASVKPQASPFCLECLEDSRISVVSFEKEIEMYSRFPRFEKMCRITTEEKLQEFQEKIAVFVSSSPEERYLHILKTRPELIQKVPQYHLASYIGVKPESLSRIRKRILG